MTPSSSTAPFDLRSAGLRDLKHRGVRSAVVNMIRYLRARRMLRKVNELGSVRVIGRVKVRNDGFMCVGDRTLLEGTIVPIELVAWDAALKIGEGCYLNYGTNISARTGVTIGNNVAIGQYSIIMDDDYHSALNHRHGGKRAPIVIEDDAWLGARVIVLRGSHVGRGAVIGANSVVTGSIPPYTIAVGSPARVIRKVHE